MRTDGKSRVGGVGAAPRIVWRPLRIGHQLAAEPLVIGDCGFNERAGFELARGKTCRDLGDRQRKCIGHIASPIKANIRPKDISPSRRNRSPTMALNLRRLNLS